MTCRKEIIEAFRRLRSRHGRDTFTPLEIIQEVQAATTRFAESTILCRPAADCQPKDACPRGHHPGFGRQNSTHACSHAILPRVALLPTEIRGPLPI